MGEVQEKNIVPLRYAQSSEFVVMELILVTADNLFSPASKNDAIHRAK
jgi:hypothetical protein